jgi:hypothetical protein
MPILSSSSSSFTVRTLQNPEACNRAPKVSHFPFLAISHSSIPPRFSISVSNSWAVKSQIYVRPGGIANPFVANSVWLPYICHSFAKMRCDTVEELDIDVRDSHRHILSPSWPRIYLIWIDLQLSKHFFFFNWCR